MSLRGLFLAITLCAIGLGWLAHQATRQRDLVRVLGHGAGTVYYDFQLQPDGTLDPNRRSSLPPWLVNILGVDLLHNVVWLHLEGETVTDETLAQVARLPSLRVLHLTKTSITEVGLLQLGQLRSLRVLTLNTPEVGDAAIARIAPLPQLAELEIYSALVTDHALESLAHSPALKRLWFEDTDVTESALDRFRAEHPHCRAGYSSPGFKTVAWRPRSVDRARAQSAMPAAK